ncbi:MAG TPA: FHA domain-containing protein [Bacillota bacterium]|nr:FHA domain-containing protein [Bacillota bacterium]
MARLVITPTSPTAWEIQLKPGANSIGRGPTNDFTITDPSVSGSHCQIVVSEHSTLLKDLGSTNGTFVNRAPVKEAALRSGQTIHLGGVEMVYYADTARPIATTATAPAPVRIAGSPPPVPVTVAPKLTLTVATTATAEPAVPPPPPAGAAAPAVLTGSQNCKFHPKTAGRYYCNQCQHFFCELCVTTRQTGGAQLKFCRQCGVECLPVAVQTAPVGGGKGFFAQLPGTFLYPFRGSGLLMLIISTIVLALLGSLGGGLFSLFSTIFAIGYLFSYMQNIIHATAAEEAEMPSLPGFDDVFGGAFRLGITVLLSFGAPIAMAVANFWFEQDIPTSVIIATVVLGCLYFPMAFLAVAMKDSALASNPLVVMPAIFKVPAEYLVTALILVSVYGVRQLGDIAMIGVKAQGYATRSMAELFLTFGLRTFWNFASVYLLTVSMRILGVLYVTKKQKLAWFDH